jgi:flagellar hook-length control protein FliK
LRKSFKVMPAETSSLRATKDSDASPWLSRKPEIDKGGLGLQADAFAEIFAATQESKPAPERGLAPREDRGTAQENSAAPQAPAHHGKERLAKKDKSDVQDDDRKQATGSEDSEAPTKPCHEKACVKKAEKSDDTSTDDTKVSDSSDADVSVSADANPQTTPDQSDAQPQAANDDTPKPVLCLATALQAQESGAAETASKGDDEGKDGESEKTAQGRFPSLPDLLSFRPDPKAGVAKAGEKPAADNAAPFAAQVADADSDAVDATLAAKSDATLDLPKKQPELAANAAQKAFAPIMPTAPQAPTAPEFTGMLGDQAPKKDPSSKPTTAEAEIKVNAEAGADATQVSQSPPAAGSRVNAPMGFSAPALTGSGGGSPSPVKGEAGLPKVDGIVAAQSTEALEAGSPVQLVRASRATVGAPITEQVSVTLTRMAKNGTNSFELQLHPAELGKVDIKLDIGKDGMVRAHIVTDNPNAYALLQKDAGSLEKVLQQAGLQTDMNSLSFSLRDDTQAQQQNAYQESPAWKRWAQNANVVEQGTEAEAVSYTAAPGRVDLRV